MAEHVVRDGETGQAIVSATGTPVGEILDAIEAEGAFDAALRLHPGLTAGAVAAALRFARVAVDQSLRYAPDAGRGGFEVRERAITPFNAGTSRGGLATLDPLDGDVGPDAPLADALESARRRRDRLRHELDLAEGAVEELREAVGGDGFPREDARADRRASGSPDSQPIEEALRSTAARREELLYELDIVECIHAGLEDIAAGRILPHEEVVARLRARFPG